MEDINLAVAVVAMFIAVFLRTYMPAVKYRKKAKDAGEDFKFDQKYTFSAVSSFGVCVIVVSMIFLGFDVSQYTHPIFTFFAAFTYAFTNTAVFNQIIDWWRDINE